MNSYFYSLSKLHLSSIVNSKCARHAKSQTSIGPRTASHRISKSSQHVSPFPANCTYIADYVPFEQATRRDEGINNQRSIEENRHEETRIQRRCQSFPPLASVTPASRSRLESAPLHPLVSQGETMDDALHQRPEPAGGGRR